MRKQAALMGYAETFKLLVPKRKAAGAAPREFVKVARTMLVRVLSGPLKGHEGLIKKVDQRKQKWNSIRLC
jgi:transcription antitermination factor NusG